MVIPHLWLDPSTSQDAKQHAREVLEAADVDFGVGAQSEAPASSAKDDPPTSRVLAGYKAALHSSFSLPAGDEPLIRSPHRS